jgi:hypothetical protein
MAPLRKRPRTPLHLPVTPDVFRYLLWIHHRIKITSHIPEWGVSGTISITAETDTRHCSQRPLWRRRRRPIPPTAAAIAFTLYLAPIHLTRPDLVREQTDSYVFRREKGLRGGFETPLLLRKCKSAVSNVKQNGSSASL